MSTTAPASAPPTAPGPAPTAPQAGRPPGPTQGRLAQAVALHRDPLGYLRRCQATYGDVFTVRMTSTGPIVVLADPEAALLVPPLDPHAAHAGAARRRMLPLASERSTFGGDADAHRAARLRLRDAFSADAMLAVRPQLQAIVRAHVDAWPRGRPFRVLPRVRCLVDELFVRLVLRVEDGPRADALITAMGGMLATPGNPPVDVPGPRDGLMGRVVGTEFLRRVSPVMALLGEELDARRAGRGPREDLLGRLVATEPERTNGELVDELLPVMMAAQEPPAAALSWMVLHLAHAPDAAARVAAGAPEDVRAFADESLRVNPPALASLRRLTQELTMGGHILPAGTVTAVPIALVQRDPRRLVDPDRFDPFGRTAADERDGGPVRLPFGDGVRRCIGEALAWEQIDALLPAVAGRLQLRPAWPRLEQARLRATILVPHRSALVIARER